MQKYAEKNKEKVHFYFFDDKSSIVNALKTCVATFSLTADIDIVIYRGKECQLQSQTKAQLPLSDLDLSLEKIIYLLNHLEFREFLAESKNYSTGTEPKIVYDIQKILQEMENCLKQFESSTKNDCNTRENF